MDYEKVATNTSEAINQMVIKRTARERMEPEMKYYKEEDRAHLRKYAIGYPIALCFVDKSDQSKL